MRLSQRKAGLAIAAFAMVLAFGTTASAAPISKCNAAKKKCIGKYIAAVMGCHSKAESKSLPVDGTCLSKATAKITGGGKGCFDKNDAKNDGCSQLGDAGSQLADADAFILDVVDDIDPNYPTPHTNKCDAAQKKCAGKKASGLMGCSAKENKDGVGDPACAPKIQGKFSNVDNKGCFDKAVIKNDGPCDGATAIGIELKVDNWVAAAAAAIDSVPATPTPTLTPTPTPTSTVSLCGNGLNDPGEKCDASAPSAGWAVCGSEFTCVACNCACPTKVTFSGDANDPNTILDTGWNGIAHRAKVISNGDVTVALSGCAGSTRPCGQCTVSGPIANTGATQLRNRRCTTDLSIQCTLDAQCSTSHCLGGANEDAACTQDSQCPGSGCSGAGGTCQFWFGGPLPLVAGGVGTCVANQFNGPVSGTANVETGDAVTVANLTSRVFSGASTDTPCPTCVGDTTINDNVAGGTCAGGPRAGEACDANGAVPGRPDFGSTSLDCQPSFAGIIATLPIDLSNTTGTVTRTITAAQPNCSASIGPKCLCDTCNNANANPCDANSDCPISGGNPGICGGRRCLGGTNDGGPCGGAGGGASACPGGGSCGRPGQPTAPNACVDTTAVPGDGTICQPIGGNVGECPEGPPTGVCALSSGHAQRSCTTASQCCDDPPGCVLDPPAGDCVITNRLCFLDNGLGGSIVASGMADLPVQDTSDPTLAAIFCIGPTSAPAVNAAAGLPGPGRTTLKGTAAGHP